MKTTKSEAEARVYLPGPKVRARYNVTDMTIHRWLNDPELNFPRPVYIGRYRYWHIVALEAWEEEQARKPNGRYSRAAGDKPEVAR